jgi:hypothetical protein
MSRKPILHPVYLSLTLIILLRELNKIIGILKNIVNAVRTVYFFIYFLYYHSFTYCLHYMQYSLINSGDFYVMFQRENHFINKRLHKPRYLNVK